MRIDIDNGYVEIDEKVTRKTMRTYNEIITEGGTSSSKETILLPAQIDKGTEFMIKTQISKAVIFDENDPAIELEQKVTTDWLDNLDNRDYSRIDNEIQRIVKEARVKAEK